MHCLHPLHRWFAGRVVRGVVRAPAVGYGRFSLSRLSSRRRAGCAIRPPSPRRWCSAPACCVGAGARCSCLLRPVRPEGRGAVRSVALATPELAERKRFVSLHWPTRFQIVVSLCLDPIGLGPGRKWSVCRWRSCHWFSVARAALRRFRARRGGCSQSGVPSSWRFSPGHERIAPRQGVVRGVPARAGRRHARRCKPRGAGARAGAISRCLTERHRLGRDATRCADPGGNSASRMLYPSPLDWLEPPSGRANPTSDDTVATSKRSPAIARQPPSASHRLSVHRARECPSAASCPDAR